MVLSSTITAVLKERLPSAGFTFPHDDEVIARLEGPCPELSPLEIREDGHDVLALIGEFSHDHFYGSGRGNERERDVADQLADFLEKLLSDRILLWQGRIIGGIEEIKGEPKLRKSADSFVWSRALSRRPVN